MDKNKKILNPKIDIVFQSLFNRERANITKSFAEAILDEKINKLVINGDKELSRENPEDKLGILDLQLDVNDNEKVDVEIQLLRKDNFKNRLIYYMSKLIAKQMKRGFKYDELKRVVIVAIIDFELEETKDIKDVVTVWNMMEKLKRDRVLTDIVEIRILELKKAKEMYEKDKNNEKAQWLMFLENPESREVKEIMEKNQGISEAVIEIHKMSEDEKMERLEYLREKAILDGEDLRLTGYNQGRREGKIEGIKEGEMLGEARGREQRQKEIYKEMIRRLREEGISEEKISSILGITEEELSSLE